MPYAIISDIHSNIEALEVILDDIKKQNIKEIYCLGDIVGYGANPKECCDLVMKHCSAGTILGNHDGAVAQNYLTSLENSLLKRIIDRLYLRKSIHELSYEVIELEDSQMSTAMKFTEKSLHAKQKAFLARLPMTLEKEDFFLTHQSPAANAFNPQNSYTLYYKRNLSYLFNVYEYFNEEPITEKRDNINITFLNRLHEELAVFALDHLREKNIRLCFMGHTHVASCFFKKKQDHNCNAVFVKHNTPEDTECKSSVELELKPGYNYIINPGSVGQPRDTDIRASYLVFDEQKITWHRIPYPFQRASQKIKDAGLPKFYADRLSTGK